MIIGWAGDKSYGSWWVVVLQWRLIVKAPWCEPLFSERHGLTKTLRLPCGWRVQSRMVPRILGSKEAEMMRTLEQEAKIERLTAENERLRAAIMEARAVAEMDGLGQWVAHFDKALSSDQQSERQSSQGTSEPPDSNVVQPGFGGPNAI